MVMATSPRAAAYHAGHHGGRKHGRDDTLPAGMAAAYWDDCAHAVTTALPGGRFDPHIEATVSGCIRWR